MSVPSRASTQVMHIIMTEGFFSVLLRTSAATLAAASGILFKCLPVTISASSISKKKNRSLYSVLSPMPEVFLPQHPGDTTKSTEPGTVSEALFTPKPSAPGELNESAAGELSIRCSADLNCNGSLSMPRPFSSEAVILNALPLN